MLGPAVATDAPPGWIEASAEVALPPLGSGSGSKYTQWSAKRSPSAGETLLLGCVATPIPGWVEDMRPTVDYRTVALMNATAERIAGAPIEARDETGYFSLHPAGAPAGAAPVGIGRSFVGWDHAAVVTCFATCARVRPGRTAAAGDPAGRRACDASVLAARLEGSTAAPRPGLVLGAMTWAVHHPSRTVAWGGILTIALGTLAVGARRRQRSRI